MEKTIYHEAIEGISYEHITRHSHFNMKVKHFHSKYEIFYIQQGARLFFIDNRTVAATAGDLILIDANVPHKTESLSDKDAVLDRIILYVTSEKMYDFDKKYPALQLVRFFHENQGVFHLNAKQRQDFLSLYHLFRSAFSSKRQFFQQEIELATLFYFLQLSRELSEYPADAALLPNKLHHVNDITAYLTEHCEDKISLDELASRFFLNKHYLCRLFKKSTGYTVFEYVNIQRVQRAKRLLEYTDYSIAEIASLTGYGSITRFEQTFKTYTDTSPLKYRKSKQH